MIFANMTFQNLHFQLRAYLTNQVANTGGNRTGQKGFAVFGYPHKMQLDVKTSMRRTTIIVNTTYYKQEIA